MISPDVGAELLDKAKRMGATDGDLVIVESSSFSATVRMGKIDKISQASGKRLGLRLFFGKRTSISATSDLSPLSLERILSDACEMTRATEEDPDCGLPEEEALVKAIPELDLDDRDAEALSVEEKIDLAKEAEDAALSSDPRITNSEGGEFSQYRSHLWYFNSRGFRGDYPAAGSSISVAPVAGKSGEMQRDYWYSTRRRFKDLENPGAVGKRAAERTLRRLGAKKVRTCEVPVVFDPEMAGSLIGNLFAAISGSAIYRGASFLIGRLGSPVASPLVTVIDDGTLPHGLGSRPFDGEGVRVRQNRVVEDGILTGYLLDSYTARKLKMKTTGNASRSIGDAPSVGPSNFYLQAGISNPDDMIKSVSAGLYLTEMIGFGVNLATGDFSRGAAGIWIENGELTHPVEEITIAGNLNEMLKNIEMVGNDLEFNSSVSAPTIKISKMTVAGE